MADGGLGYGAAQHVYREKTGDKTHTPIRDVYWGPEYSQQEIESALQQSKLNYQHRGETIVQDIVDLLQQNKVVAHFNGRMEFGPRALGNRSILYPATDPSVNEWLNEHLHRSEFMPFAPVTLAEKARECYPDIGGAEFTSEFMTITCHCTPKMHKQSPAVVHVDGTARPQLTSEAKNPRYYNILKEYYKRTNIPSLVNTSFNMHEEPIVCSPNDAIRSFLNGNLDALSIGDFLVRKEQ
jgi:carbamoyltransferase